MNQSEHDKAQALASQAAVLAAAGRNRARAKFARAADTERRAFASVPRDKPRTRALLGISLASLLFKAERYDEAETAICMLLSDVPAPFAQHEVRDLLSAWCKRTRGQLRVWFPTRATVWHSRSSPGISSQRVVSRLNSALRGNRRQERSS